MEIWVSVITALITAITTLAAVWYRNHLHGKNKEKEIDPVQAAVEVDTELLSKIEDLRIKSGADRAALYQFHNGGEFYTGKSMQKMSNTYEVVGKGIERILPMRQGLPVSACNSTLSKLLPERRLKFYDVEEDYPESLCKYNLSEAGVQSHYIWAIFDLNKNTVGVFMLDFVKGKKKLTQSKLDMIELNVIKMPGYLE